MPEPLTKVRKPKARKTEIVLGCIEERLFSMDIESDSVHAIHLQRVRDLLDELKRSLNGSKEADSE